jgi:hypothetical protein
MLSLELNGYLGHILGIVIFLPETVKEESVFVLWQKGFALRRYIYQKS